MTSVTNNNRFHNVASENIFLYPLEYQIRGGNPNKDKHHIVNEYLQQLVLSHPKQISSNQPSRKRWDMKLVDAIKHLSQKMFLLRHHH